MSKILTHIVSACSLLNVLIVFGYVAKSTSASALFFWHPIPLVLGFMLLMTQATLLLVSEHSLIGMLAGSASRKIKVQIHFWLQVVAATFITCGFLAIFINKINNGKSHFTSWHSWVGLVTALLSWAQIFIGVWMYMSRFREIISWIVQLPPDITVKKIHRLLGALTYLIAAITFFLAVTTGYAERNFPSAVNVTIAINVGIMTAALIPLSIRMNVPAWLQ